MWFFSFLLFPFLSMVYIALLLLGGIYLYMGIQQVAVSGRIENKSRLTGGLVAIACSISLIVLASLAYFKWVWLWS